LPLERSEAQLSQMERDSMDSSTKYLTRRAVARRYSVTTRTICRWEKAGMVPAPRTINGRKYFALDELDRLDREAARTGRERVSS
jgi:predicted site-specific integrase-resolvase